MTILKLLLVAAALPIYQMSREQLDAYLSELHTRKPSLNSRIEDVLERSLGAPYANGPLGEGPNGEFDPDPLMDLERVDCVTFVEQTLALAMETSYAGAFDTLQRIRYHHGRRNFEHRNHFMIGDWIADNSFCRDTTDKCGAVTAEVTRTISKKDFFKKVEAPGLGEETPDRQITISYVPSDAAGKAVVAMPSPALVVFIGKVEWLFALHSGFFVRKGDKTLLYHASSKSGDVTTTDFLSYLEEQSDRYIGYTVYALDGVNLPVGN